MKDWSQDPRVLKFIDGLKRAEAQAEAVWVAVDDLERDGHKATERAVAARTGLSKTTVHRIMGR